MSIKESALRLVLKARDTLSRPVQQSAQSLEELRSKTQELKKQLSTLEGQDKLLSSFQKQQVAVRDAGKAYREAEQKVVALARQYKQTDKPSKDLQRSLNNARKAVIASNAAYQKQRGKLAELRGSLDKANLSNKNLAQQQDKVQKELKETSDDLQEVATQSKRTGASLKRTGFKKVAKDANAASKGINRLATRIAGLVTAGAAFVGIKRGMLGVLQTGDQFERLQIQLEAIFKSAEAGNEAFEWIKQFTKDTPLQLEQVADSFVLLKNFGLDPMDGTLQALVDLNSKLGGNMEKLRRISLAVGQAWGKQKLQGEELRQLVEAGVPVWEMLAKVTNKNANELRKLSETGKLGRDVIRDLLNEIAVDSAGAAAKNMSLFSGLVSNMVDRWDLFKVSISEQGWGAYVKEQLTFLGYKLDELARNGKLKEIAESISDGFISIAETVKSAFSDVTVESFTASINTSFKDISEGLVKVQKAFVVAGASISVFFNGFKAGINGFRLLISSALALVTNNVTKVLDAFGADKFAAKMATISASFKATMAEFSAKVLEDSKAVNEGLAKLGKTLVGNNKKTQKHIQRDNKKTIDELLGNYPEVAKAAKKTTEEVKSAFKDAADAMSQINGAETRSELSDLGVALAKAFADGTLSQEEYTKALEASKEKLKELERAAKDAGDAAGSVGDSASNGAQDTENALDGLAGFYNNVTSELHSLSSQAEDAFHAIQGATQVDTSDAVGEVAQLKAELKAAKDEVNRLAHASPGIDTTGLNAWMIGTAQNSAKVKQQFYEQRVALKELLEKYESGSLSAEKFTGQGKALSRTLDLLDQQDLDQLIGAIEQAESSMEQLNESSRSTLLSLQDELDQLQGKQDEVERRAYQERRRELELQLEEARQGGDRKAIANLQKSLSLNQRIFEEKRKQRKQEEREEAQREFNKSRQRSNPPTATSPKSPQARSPDKIIRLEYPGGTVNVGVASNDEAKLLEALRSAGMRSL